MDARDPKMLQRVHRMRFAVVYPLLVAKAEKKGRTKGEVDTVVKWLTGLDETAARWRVPARIAPR